MKIKDIYNSFLDIIMPRKCPVCGAVLTYQEPYMCIKCMEDIPLTRFNKDELNSVEQLFAGKVPIERASSLFFYSKGSPYASILHDIKYHNQPLMGEWITSYLAKPLLTTGFFDNIDYITPIPLHYIKMAQRGYNQSMYIAYGVSKISGIPICSALKADKEHETQTHKNSYERILNTQDIFTINKNIDLSGKHILIVDDVITTGATILSAATELHKHSDVKISVLSLALAQL